MKTSDYVMLLGEGTDTKEWESVGYVIYTNPDGITYLAVEKNAPEEAHALAASAAQGDPEANDEIMGDYMPTEE
jgi:hypothetical protein